MILHLIPKIMNNFSDVKIKLVGITVPELDLTLEGGVDLKVGKPYPNQTMNVACIKKGREVFTGFCIETDKSLTEFTVITNWLMDDKTPLTHQVDYEVVGDGELVTDAHSILNRFHRNGNHLTIDAAPSQTKPRMDVLFNGRKHSRDPVVLEDTYSSDGTLVLRKEKIRINPISLLQYNEYINEYKCKLPSLESAIYVAGGYKPEGE
ncbi:DUF6012 family protein [Vibrio coralliirubri]|uniref:DUF6012 family protein n=1 Tax=Vibrio coralliirubri TaxID=1516159 RepID=UPI0022850B67|nr:DUF6012 family protein [Vibrio coralliirubri]MCY9866447.1 DUF6012 family protein [Vibrio coralliirubri]